MKSRRKFIQQAATLAAGTSLSLPLFSCGTTQENQTTKKTSTTNKEKLGVALVGLGLYSTGQLAPALQQTQYCELKGIVTGSPEKIPQWQEQYNIPDSNVYNYETMHQIADNDEIDIIYIVLPNSMHKEYAIKAAETGKHVWCEKPMALNVDECEAIINACKKNNVALSIGYRMQHEPNTKQLIDFSKSKQYGALQSVKAQSGFRFSNPTPWRLQKSMGGGALYDIGVYCINGARYSTQEEPIAVTAREKKHRPEIYFDVDETMYFELEFPSGVVAECKTSMYESYNLLEVQAENGWYSLSPMMSYGGVQGSTSDGILLNAPVQSQQAIQMDDDAYALLHDKDLLVTGEEGLRDVRIVEAIFEAGSTGERVLL